MSEERRLVDQVRKVLQDEGLPITVSCIQSPVFYGHAQVVHLEALRRSLPKKLVANWKIVTISNCPKKMIIQPRSATPPAAMP